MPPREALKLSPQDREDAQRGRGAIHRLGLPWGGRDGSPPLTAVYSSRAMFDDARDAFGLEPSYFGGWYDPRGHSVHMPGHGLSVGDDDERARDWLHEFLHATRRGNTLIAWASGGRLRALEALTEVQTLAALVQGIAPIPWGDTTSPYASWVTALRSAVPDHLEVSQILEAADGGLSELAGALEELFPGEDLEAVLAKGPKTPVLSREVLLWLGAIALR